MSTALSLVLAYLLGAIPFAYLIGRLNNVDIRNIGDRNVGAFNVFRHVGWAAGIATLVADMAKGALAIVLTKALTGQELVALFAGGAVVAGHNWTPFLRFQGGRGAAPIVGIMLALIPREMAIALALSIIILFTTRNSIFCSIGLFVPPPLLSWLFGEPLSLVVYSMALPCLSGLTHWLTTRRLSPQARKESATFWVAPREKR